MLQLYIRFKDPQWLSEVNLVTQKAFRELKKVALEWLAPELLSS